MHFTYSWRPPFKWVLHSHRFVWEGKTLWNDQKSADKGPKRHAKLCRDQQVMPAHWEPQRKLGHRLIVYRKLSMWSPVIEVWIVLRETNDWRCWYSESIRLWLNIYIFYYFNQQMAVQYCIIVPLNNTILCTLIIWDPREQYNLTLLTCDFSLG